MFFIKSAASLPDIKEGGTPGPGTVSCPVKYRDFSLSYSLDLGLKKSSLRKRICHTICISFVRIVLFFKVSYTKRLIKYNIIL